MTQEAYAGVEAVSETPLSSWMARHTLARWELAVSGVAVLAAAIAVWATLRADFLAHPGWLALQKADFILDRSRSGCTGGVDGRRAGSVRC